MYMSATLRSSLPHPFVSFHLYTTLHGLATPLHRRRCLARLRLRGSGLAGLLPADQG